MALEAADLRYQRVEQVLGDAVVLEYGGDQLISDQTVYPHPGLKQNTADLDVVDIVEGEDDRQQPGGGLLYDVQALVIGEDQLLVLTAQKAVKGGRKHGGQAGRKPGRWARR